MKLKKLIAGTCFMMTLALVGTSFMFNSQDNDLSEKKVYASTNPTNSAKRLDKAVALFVGSSQAVVNNTEAQVDSSNAEVVPFVENGRTLVPVRFISEKLGAKVEWDHQSATVKVTLKDKVIQLVIGSKNMKVGSKDVALDGTTAQIKSNRTYIPLRALVEALGKEVYYDRGLIVISDEKNIFNASEKADIDKLIARVNNLPKVASDTALRDLVKNSVTYRSNSVKWKSLEKAEITTTAALDGDIARGAAESSMKQSVTKDESNGASNKDYSTTNVQVQGVDEADVVKTDGNYIYQVNKQRIVIAKANPANEMKIVKMVEFNAESLIPQELYVDGKYMVVIGSYFKNATITQKENGENSKKLIPYYLTGTLKAIVYDITDKTDIKKLREVELEGDYVSSRKIGSTLYLIANKYIDTYTFDNNRIITPCYRDTAVKDEYIGIEPSDIRYFPGNIEPNYMIVGAVDLEKNSEEANVQTYLGSGQNVYASQEGLYVAVTGYKQAEIQPAAEVSSESGMVAKKRVVGLVRPMDMSNEKTIVYKFSLNGSQVTYLNKGEVPGRILNQFSMDENGKYFRIATTKGNEWGTGEHISKNNLYVLDETMAVSGKVEDIAPGERIYSVRFMGDRAYMVTFKKVDPLFVIDLKDPKNPNILGKLKIPGYSDYLHPYDENHIIGFGKDTVEDQYGGAYYMGMKIALFDVTDVNNPKQKFSEIIGDRGTDSELLRNHKALLFNKNKNLMAFPVTLMEVQNKNQGKTADSGVQYGQFTYQGAYIYHIDLEKGFSLKGRISHMTDEDYKKVGDYWYDSASDKSVERILYIGDTLYTLSKGAIKANSMNDLKEIQTLQIP